LGIGGKEVVVLAGRLFADLSFVAKLFELDYVLLF
jgi:hypothetical protein